jgi:hypothetical protein
LWLDRSRRWSPHVATLYRVWCDGVWRSMDFGTELVGGVGGGCGGGCWRRSGTCGGAQAGAVEDHGFYFAFGALGRELLAVEGEAYASGVSGSDYDFAGGTDQGVSGCDERFVDYGLAVGGHGDPGIF